MSAIENLVQMLKTHLPFLHGKGINSLADAHAHLADLSNHPDLDSETAQKLVAHVRLAAISPDVELNQKLVDAGIGGVTELAAANVSDLASRIGSKVATLEPIQCRARVYRKVARAKLAEDKIANALQDQGSSVTKRLNLDLSSFRPEKANEALEYFIVQSWNRKWRQILAVPQGDRTNLNNLLTKLGGDESILQKEHFSAKANPETQDANAYVAKLMAKGIKLEDVD